MHHSRNHPLATGWTRAEQQRIDLPRALNLARYRDISICLGLIAFALALYIATLLPGIGSRDTAEFQRAAPTLGLAHPTGYPLYLLLGWLWSHLPLGGTPAWRMNLFSAATAALAVGVIYLAARAMGQRSIVAAAAALALAVSRTFWSQATIAEVYGLAGLLEALLILALLRWRAGRWPFWLVGLLLGLALAHHRTIILLVPGALCFILLSRRPRPVEAGAALLALLGAGLLYLYIPLRAPAGTDRWEVLRQYMLGADMLSNWLDPARLHHDGSARLLDLARRFLWPQLLPIGALLALLGAVALLWRDRALAALLLGGYALVCTFCAMYYVDDIEVFFIPAHLIAALLLGEGAMLLFGRRPAIPIRDDRRPLRLRSGQATTDDRLGRGWRMEDRRSRLRGLRTTVLDLQSSIFSRWWSVVGDRRSAVGLLVLLPALLFNGNLRAIQEANRPTTEQAAREILAQPLPWQALLIGDWSMTEGLHYLQDVEGLRPDLDCGTILDRQLIVDILGSGRAVYLLQPAPELGLAQWPEGRLWRVGAEPLAGTMPIDRRWEEGIRLASYLLPPGPYQPGQVVPVTLAWEAAETPRAAYTLFVHLIGPDGMIYGQQDRPPTAAPTDQWRPGRQTVDLYSPVLNPSAPPGRYRVTLGWYTAAPERRLQLADIPEDEPADYIILGEIEVALGQ